MGIASKLPTNIYDFCAAAEAGYEQMLANERRVFPANHNRASSLGHPCVRYLALQRVRGQDADLPSTGLQAIFRQGKIVEQATIRELQEMGLEWVWGERPFIDQDHCISGNVDGGVRVEHRTVFPGEIKSMQGSAWEAVRPGVDGLEDLLHHRSWFVRKYPTQVSLYLHLSGEDAGMLVLRDKWFWRLRLVPIARERVEPIIKEALEKADMVNQHIAAGTLPGRIDYQDQICGRCEYKAICLPSHTGKGTAWIDDVAIIEELQERDHMKALADRYAALDKSLKEKMKATGEPEIIVGGQYLIQNRTQKKRRMVATGEEYEITVTSIRELDKPLVPLRGGASTEGGSDDQ